MKKVLLVMILFTLKSFAYEIYDAEWCRKNGGFIEFDKKYNISFNCMTNNVYEPSYVKKLYNAVCRPCFSLISKNEEAVFLKIVSDQDNRQNPIFDKYNWKIGESELFRYI